MSRSFKKPPHSHYRMIDGSLQDRQECDKINYINRNMNTDDVESSYKVPSVKNHLQTIPDDREDTPFDHSCGIMYRIAWRIFCKGGEKDSIIKKFMEKFSLCLGYATNLYETMEYKNDSLQSKIDYKRKVLELRQKQKEIVRKLFHDFRNIRNLKPHQIYHKLSLCKESNDDYFITEIVNSELKKYGYIIKIQRGFLGYSRNLSLSKLS